MADKLAEALDKFDLSSKERDDGTLEDLDIRGIPNECRLSILRKDVGEKIIHFMGHFERNCYNKKEHDKNFKEHQCSRWLRANNNKNLQHERATVRNRELMVTKSGLENTRKTSMEDNKLMTVNNRKNGLVGCNNMN
ncbi:hypothetical protein ACH5RR_034152 [Cinchona calisaya]|uniref:Uncharacterized protein n=1 Tax=Cinchona calisaya TaxID=153742 RepID=A0ABD2YC88_9GENT